MLSVHFFPPLLNWFWIALVISALCMKLSSFLATRAPRPSFFDFVFLSPVLSTISWAKKTPFQFAVLKNILLQSGTLFVLFVLSARLYLNFVPGLHPNIIIQSYFSLIPIYLMGQFLSTVFELIYLPTGWHFPAHFQYPPLSKTLAEFWSARWATWVSDWFNQMIFKRLNRRPMMGLFAVFIVSGLWHELLINLPLYLFGGVNLIGSMMVYFVIQAVGILGEKKLPLGNGVFHRLYLWAVVVIPAPLIMNECVLRAFGMYFQK